MMPEAFRMVFKTRSGSVYELDEAGKRFRWLAGDDSRAARYSEWTTYLEASEVRVGQKVTIFFPGEAGRFVMTTPVVSLGN
jgi:hypothetical protein